MRGGSERFASFGSDTSGQEKSSRCERRRTWSVVSAALLIGCLLCAPPGYAGASAGATSVYVFQPDHSTIVQTGGIAGVHWTYRVEGRFQLTVDSAAGTASFDRVDANAWDDSPFKRTLDPNETFNLTGLAGTIVDGGKSIRFQGKSDDGSSVSIMLTFADGTVTLKGRTTPPPDSADFFTFALDAVAHRKYAGGTGEPNDPYQIATAADLIALGETPEDYDKHFLLTADIDLDPNLPGRKVFDKAVIAPATAPGGPWHVQPRTPFSGVLDGNGRTVSHLTITGSEYLGLFGLLESGATVKDLGLAHVDVAGSGQSVGGLVGLNYGQTRACYVRGQVQGGFQVGGFVGDNYGTITACYAQVRVGGTGSVGGFAGSAGGTIVRCYATGQVVLAEGCDFFGGFAGQGSARGSIQGCLWDTQASGIDVSGCGIGLDTAELVESEVYSLNGWAGDPNWVLAFGQDYPRLAWEGSYGQAIGEPIIDWLAGSGTLEDPYQIATGDQLARIGTASILWDKALVLVAELDVNRIQIRRIGICPGSDFRGRFDGRGHTIRNLTMDTGPLSAWWMGLFGWIHHDGWVSNLSLENAVIKGGGERSAGLGALAGSNRGSISNCVATSLVVDGQSAHEGGSAYLGGLVGYSEGIVSRCRATGRVRGDWLIGGLVGLNYGNVLHCSADTAVSGRQASMGGLVGTSSSRIPLSPLGADPDVVRRATIENSYATGRVEGDEDSSDVGGLVGSNQGGDITGCYATGVASGGHWVGGLAGYNGSGGTITDSYARGDVVGHSVMGGLVAANAGTVATCYATGKTAGDEYIGGLVGNDWSGDVAGSLWDIQTSGLFESNGGTGKTTAEMQTASTFLDAGWDFVGEKINGTEDTWWILEGQDWPHLSWERVLGDDFEDGKAEPLWMLYEPWPEAVRIKEVDGKLEVEAIAQTEDVDAIYVANGWRLDATKDFALRVDFHFSRQGPGDGRVTLGVVPSLDPAGMQWAELEAGCFDTGPFYLYEVRDGFWVEERVTDRSSDGGTLYLSYNPDTDELYFSYTGYGKANAWQTVPGLLKGRWAGEPIYVILSGGSEGMALTGTDAWLDNFVLNAGVVQAVEPAGIPDADGGEPFVDSE
jgi:hypothetical protein